MNRPNSIQRTQFYGRQKTAVRGVLALQHTLQHLQHIMYYRVSFNARERPLYVTLALVAPVVALFGLFLSSTTQTQWDADHGPVASWRHLSCDSTSNFMSLTYRTSPDVLASVRYELTNAAVQPRVAI